MKPLRLVLPLVALAGMLSSGCVLTTAQLLATFELPDPLPVSSTALVVPVPVDLNAVDEYRKHKGNLEDIADLAFLGRFSNMGPEVGIEIWMTPGPTAYTTADAVRADPAAVRVWGPLPLPAGTPSAPTVTVPSWDRSAALFGAGKAPLVGQIKGDGAFTLYVLGSSGSYDVSVGHGALAVVLAAGL